MVRMDSTLRLVVVPATAYTALQLHKYTKFSWVMELMLVYAMIAPYLHPEKKMVDVGIQTNDESPVVVVNKRTHRINKMFCASLLVGVMGYMMTMVF